MRTKEQISFLKTLQSDSVQIDNALSSEKIKFLLDHYNNSLNKITKNTGPKVSYVKEGEDIIDDILVDLRKQFGNFKVRSAHYFEVDNPHILHIDDDFKLPNTYKAFTIPLWVESNDCNKIKLVMFDQYYYGGPVKFFNGESKIKETYYNEPLFNYKEVENLSDTPIPKAIKNAMLTHLKDSWLEGLSVKNFFPWTIGSIIAFDSLRIHCSSDFRKVGIKKKIGLSIFTEM
jgi:hypothetical protein